MEQPYRISQKQSIDFQSRTQRPPSPFPALGEHTGQILEGLLNFSPKEIQKLREKKVI